MCRNYGENDPYDILIAPMNIFENQVIPVGIQNLSESFRPNLAKIQVVSLGTNFIPRWSKTNTRNTFKRFNDFKNKMNTRVYFTETKSGVFERKKNVQTVSRFCSPKRIR